MCYFGSGAHDFHGHFAVQYDNAGNLDHQTYTLRNIEQKNQNYFDCYARTAFSHLHK